MREITHYRCGSEANAALMDGFEWPGSDSGAGSGNSGLVIVFVGNYGGAEGASRRPERKFSGIFVRCGAFAVRSSFLGTSLRPSGDYPAPGGAPDAGVRYSVRILENEPSPLFTVEKTVKREADAGFY